MECKKIVKSRGADFHIYTLACEFFNCANVLVESHIGSSPHIVNIAFSIELFIKSMDVTRTINKALEEGILSRYKLTVHGRAKGGKASHSLYNMFLSLSEDTKSKTIDCYKQIHNLNLLDDLKEVEFAFVDYRYVFEKGHIHINLSTLMRLAAFLKDHIINVLGFSFIQSSEYQPDI